MSLILSGTDGLSDVDGSAATPAIRGTDANTGIFFPAADTIAFSEGGVESMRLNSSGVLVTTNDASISGLTVGKGGGALTSNTVVGLNAQVATAGGGEVTAIGNNALTNNISTTSLTAVGSNSLFSNTTGQVNVGVGKNTLYFNTTGSFNVALGMQALQSNTTASNNTAVGYQAGYTTTVGNTTSVGYRAGYLSTTGGSWVAVGNESLYSNTTGSENTSLGSAALFTNTTGSSNVAVGRQALFSNTTASNNTAVGYFAGNINTTGTQNTYIGGYAGYGDNGNNNTFVGYSSGKNAGTVPVTALSNTAIGHEAFVNATTGSYNTAVGRLAGRNITSGNGNTCISPLDSAGNYNPVNDPTTGSNLIVMGSTGITNAYVKVSWTVTSDARDKTEITPIPHGLNFINQLNPVSYRFTDNRIDKNPTGDTQYGFLAQEVLALEGDNPVMIDNKDQNALKYKGESLVPVLVKAIQELKAEVDSLKAQLNK